MSLFQQGYRDTKKLNTKKTKQINDKTHVKVYTYTCRVATYPLRQKKNGEHGTIVALKLAMVERRSSEILNVHRQRPTTTLRIPTNSLCAVSLSCSHLSSTFNYKCTS